MSEEEHERRKRIRTNPFTGTFHYFPGRYSALHGLQRFRGQAAFLHSFDELDRLAALGRRVSQRVREAGNPAQAASFLHGVFATPAAAAATPTKRRSLYPHKTKAGAALYAELTLLGVLPRYRYGGAVDTSRRFGSSLDDGCLTVHPASSLYADILYRWNGFRLHHVNRVRQQQGGPAGGLSQPRRVMKRHGSVFLEMGMLGSLDGGLGGGQGQGQLVHSLSMHVPQGSMLLSRTSSVPADMMDLSAPFSTSASSHASDGSTPTRGGSSSNHHGGPLPGPGFRSLKGRSPQRGGLDVLNGGGGDYHMDPDEIPGSSSSSGDDEGGPASPASGGDRSRRRLGLPGQQRRVTPPLPALPRGGVGRVVTAPARPGGHFGSFAVMRGAGRPPQHTSGRPPRGNGGGGRGLAFGLVGGGSGGGGGQQPQASRAKVGDRYDVAHAEVLGEGSYATVYGARSKETGEAVAVKAIKRRYLFSEEEKASVRSEVENMRRLPRHHRNLIGLLETFETAEHVYLVMERSTHGNLEQMLQLRCVAARCVVGLGPGRAYACRGGAGLLCSLFVCELFARSTNSPTTKTKPPMGLNRSTHSPTTTSTLPTHARPRRKLTELETMWVLKQLLDAVSAMHAASVVHCDIKPHNLLFSDAEGAQSGASPSPSPARLWMYTSPLGMVLKVCDFGLSRKVPDARYYKHTGDIYRVPFSRMVGTCGFIPPEIIRKQAYGKPADMWSVGVVCYKMLTGSLPFIPPTKCLEQPVSFRGRVWDTVRFLRRSLAFAVCCCLCIHVPCVHVGNASPCFIKSHLRAPPPHPPRSPRTRRTSWQRSSSSTRGSAPRPGRRWATAGCRRCRSGGRTWPARPRRRRVLLLLVVAMKAGPAGCCAPRRFASPTAGAGGAVVGAAGRGRRGRATSRTSARAGSRRWWRWARGDRRIGPLRGPDGGGRGRVCAFLVSAWSKFCRVLSYPSAHLPIHPFLRVCVFGLGSSPPQAAGGPCTHLFL